MNITKEQAKVALNVLSEYFRDTHNDNDANYKKYVKSLLRMQTPTTVEKLYVDMTQERPNTVSYQYMEDFDDFFRGIPPFEIAKGVTYGEFDPDDAFFFFTMDDEIMSVKDSEMAMEAFAHLDKIAEYVIDRDRVQELWESI